jgi:hypothetical protein
MDFIDEVFSKLNAPEDGGVESTDVNEQAQGGEINDEKSEPQANAYSDEQRQADEQEQAGTQIGVQADYQQGGNEERQTADEVSFIKSVFEASPSKSQEEATPIATEATQEQAPADDAGFIDSVFAEGALQQAQGGVTASEQIQPTEVQGAQAGPQAGQGLRSQVPARDEAEVIRSEVPSFASKLTGAALSPLAYMGENAWNAIAGIARTINADEVASYASEQAAGAIENLEALDIPIAKEGAGKTAAEVGAFLLEAPLMFTTGGIPLFLGQGYGAMKEDLYKKYKQEGISDEEANKKSSIHAGVVTGAMMPAYALGAQGALSFAPKVISNEAPAMLQLIGRLGLLGAANSFASAAVRGFAAAIEGEDVMSAVKDVTLPGFLMDITFASHKMGEWFNKSPNKAAMLKDMPDHIVGFLKKQGDELAVKEMERRSLLNTAAEAEQVGLPETAKVVEATSSLPTDAVERAIAQGIAPEKAQWLNSKLTSQWKGNDDILRRVDEFAKTPEMLDEYIKQESGGKKPGDEATAEFNEFEETPTNFVEEAKASGVPKEHADALVKSMKDAGMNDDDISLRLRQFREMNEAPAKPAEIPSIEPIEPTGKAPIGVVEEVMMHEGPIVSKTVKAIKEAAKVLGVELVDETDWSDKLQQVKDAAAKKIEESRQDPLVSVSEEPQAVTPSEGTTTPGGIIAYHASLEDFDKFDVSKIGTGEGTADEGIGMYFSTDKGINAQYYKMFDSANVFSPDKKAFNYKVHIPIPKGDLLHLDKPISEQSERIKEFFGKTTKTGREAYNEIIGDIIRDQENDVIWQAGHTYEEIQRDAKESAAEFLREGGMEGIIYHDEHSASGDAPVENIVIFDPQKINILEKKQGVFNDAPEPPVAVAERPAPDESKPYLEKAAFKATNPETGEQKTFTGTSHDEAIEKASKEGFVTDEYKAQHIGDENASNRNTPEYGFLDQNGIFRERGVAKEIAEEAGQTEKGTEYKHFDNKGNPLLHSDEVKLGIPDDASRYKTDVYNMIEDMAARERGPLPRKVLMEEIRTPKQQNALVRMLRKLGLFQSDLSALGIKTSYDKNQPGVLSGFKKAVNDMADILHGSIVPALTKAGALKETVQHAQANTWVAPHTNSRLAELFPDFYNEEGGLKMRAAFRAFAKDSIVGEVNAMREELGKIKAQILELEGEYEKGTAKRGGVAELNKLIEQRDNLEDAITDIYDAHDIEGYKRDVQAASKQDWIAEAAKKWAKIINKEVDEYDSTLNAYDPNIEPARASPVFGVKMNILSEEQANRYKEFFDSDKEQTAPKMASYRKPDVRDMRRDKPGAYSSSISDDPFLTLSSLYAGRVNEVTKYKLYEALVAKRAGKWGEPSEQNVQIDGVDAVKWQAKVPVRSEKGGKTTYREKVLWVKPEVYQELEQVVDIKGRPESNPVLRKVTELQLLGIADFVSHAKNIQGVIANTLGQDTALKDFVNKIPLVGSANAIREIYSVAKEIAADTPRIRRELAEVAGTSGLRPEVEQQGALAAFNKLTHAHETLMIMDKSARIILNRRWKNLVDRGLAVPSEEGKIQFVNQIGQYNRRLMNRYVAAARDQGWSPFVVAGLTMNQFAKKMVTSIFSGPTFKTPSARASIEARLMQASGLAMAATIPALINLATTGNMNGRAGTPVGAIDFGPSFDTEDGKRRTFDLFNLLMIRRGLRALGINAAIEGIKEGKSLKMIQKDILNDGITTILHPFLGPGLGLAVETLTGKRLDLRTGYAGSYTARNVGGIAQYVENFRTGLQQQNEFLYNAGGGFIYETLMDKLGGIPAPSEQKKPTIFPSAVEDVLPSAVTGAANVVAGAAGFKVGVSPALKLSAQLGDRQQYTPEQDMRYSYRREIDLARRRGDYTKAAEVYAEGMANQILTTSDERILKGKMNQPDLLIQRVKKLKTPQDAMEVFMVATPEEKNNIMPSVLEKINGSSSLTVPQRNAMLQEFYRVYNRD